jgi:hypothetical protein
MGSLTGPAPRDREREAARTMPALYQLLPSFPEAATWTHDGKPADLFARASWQKSVLATMKEFIRMVGSDREPEALLDQFLGDAKTLIETANALDMSGTDVLPEGRDGWLPIARGLFDLGSRRPSASAARGIPRHAAQRQPGPAPGDPPSARGLQRRFLGPQGARRPHAELAELDHCQERLSDHFTARPPDATRDSRPRCWFWIELLLLIESSPCSTKRRSSSSASSCTTRTHPEVAARCRLGSHDEVPL